MTSFSQFRLLLLVTALVGMTKRTIATTASMRGSTQLSTEIGSAPTTIQRATDNNNNNDSTASIELSPSRQNRRRLVRESTCTLFRKCVSYPPSDEHPKGHHVDSWVCKLSPEDQEQMDGIQFVDLIETEAVRDTITNSTSGGSLMTVSHAIIDTEEPRMTVPADAVVHVHDHVTGNDRVHPRSTEIDRGLHAKALESRNNNNNNNNRRKLAKTKGTLNTLVIRVIDRNGVQPSSNTNQLINDVFNDGSSLKTQTEKCSHDKLRIQPFKQKTPSGTYINNGVVDIKMDFDIKSNDKGMDQAALKAAREKLGDLDHDMFDLLLICFPPGKSDFLAYAYPNSKYSFYNDKWCGYVAAQMHEVGHNLGLAHSGEPGQGEYGDGSGYMGGSTAKDDFKSCYNPQKNYQLGWYDDQSTSIYPLDGKDRREFTLNGVVDYGKNKKNLVVLRLSQPNREQDYYIGYNRAVDFNSQTGENKDHITIVRKEYGSPDQYGQSTKIFGLSPGQRGFIDNYNDSGKTVQIAFIGLTKDGDARIMVLEGKNPPHSSPKSCQKFTVEVVTDGYPGDTSWYFRDNDGHGRIGALSMPFNKKNTEFRQEVCLPRGRNDKTYEFRIEDKYGDGILNDEGYRVLNGNGQVLFSGGKNFKDNWESNDVSVKGDSSVEETSPPTDFPTMAPTPTPPCRKYVVEVKTDSYPGDTSWVFVRKDGMGDEIVDEMSPVYSGKAQVITTEVCLRTGSTYEFRFFDSYGDGVCCGGSGDANEAGYYKIEDPATGKVVMDSGIKDIEFTEKIYSVAIPHDDDAPAPTPSPTQKPTSKGKCKDKAKKKFKLKKRSRKKSCRQLRKAKKCNTVIEGGKYDGMTVAKVCKKSCKKC